jgi:hypothetical protein
MAATLHQVQCRCRFGSKAEELMFEQMKSALVPIADKRVDVGDRPLSANRRFVVRFPYCERRAGWELSDARIRFHEAMFDDHMRRQSNWATRRRGRLCDLAFLVFVVGMSAALPTFAFGTRRHLPAFGCLTAGDCPTGASRASSPPNSPAKSAVEAATPAA